MCKFPLAVFLVGLIVSATASQEIPKGIRYKRTTDEIHSRAKALFEKALLKGAVDADLDAALGSDVIMCGPFVWELVGDTESFKGATPVGLMVGSAVLQGKGIKQSDQKRLMWKRLMDKMMEKGLPVVRKANADEISFYWAMIPFDIQEPLLIADYGKEKILVNFVVKNDQPKFFWIDLVKDLGALK